MGQNVIQIKKKLEKILVVQQIKKGKKQVPILGYFQYILWNLHSLYLPIQITYILWN